MLKVIFYGLKNETLKIEAANIRDILKLQRNEKFKLQPIALRFESGKLLFYHDNIINTFVSDVDMSMIELLDFCACKAIYRNTKTVITHDKITIDKGALWKQVADNLILVDDDQYIESELDTLVFEKIV